MDITKSIIDPARIDSLRGAIEDRFALSRAWTNSTWLDGARAWLSEQGLACVHVWTSCGLDGALVCDTAYRARMGLDTPIDAAHSQQLLCEGLHLNTGKLLFAASTFDLALGLCLSTIDAESREFLHDAMSLKRCMGERRFDGLSHIEALQTVSVKNKQDVIVEVATPEVRNFGSYLARHHIRCYEVARGISSGAIDPSKTWVPGLEAWHNSEQPTEFFQMDLAKRVDLVTWIRSVFDYSASTKTCPGTSYGLKHIFEDGIKRDRQWGLPPSPAFYVSNGEFKGAMIATGFVPTNPNQLNHKYRIKYKTEISRNRDRIRHEAHYPFA